MQGLGSAPISLAESDELKNTYLPRVAKGEAIAAFALTEPDAGSDVAACRCRRGRWATITCWTARRLSFRTAASRIFTWCFARTGEAPGARGLSAFVVDAGTPGFEIAERIDVTAPHPLARLRFQSCRVPLSRLVGTPGEGFKIAMRSLDIFRAGVAAAALGFARRALDEALARVTTRKMFGQMLCGLSVDAGRARRHGNRDRRRGSAHLSRRVVARRRKVCRRREKPRWRRWPPPRVHNA